MKTITFFLKILYLSGIITGIPLQTFSQNVGINTSNPTETLDINGGIRIRNVPTAGQTDYLVGLDQNGRAYQVPFDSLSGNSDGSGGGPDGEMVIELIAGDTIVAGDCIAIGDGVTGVSRIQTGAFPSTADPMKNTWWLAQTFMTNSKTVGIKAVFLTVDIYGRNPADTLYCSIRALSGGIPIGNDIGGIKAKVDGPGGNGSSFTTARAVFYPPVVLQPNTSYVLIMRTVQSSPSVYIHKQNLGTYPYGHALVSFDTGVTWQAQPTFDFNCQFYFCETEAGKAYPCYPSLMGSSTIGWTITDNSCWESTGCNSAYFGKNDRYDNIVGIAQHDALPGDTVVVQVVGATNAVNSFPLGKKLYAGMPPGKLSTTATYPKVIGLSTGNGMVIQVGH